MSGFVSVHLESTWETGEGNTDMPLRECHNKVKYIKAFCYTSSFVWLLLPVGAIIIMTDCKHSSKNSCVKTTFDDCAVETLSS